jgi:site-specific recombinase XerD
LTRALIAAGIDKPGITTHKLRHSFACMMLRGGADLSCLQRIMGHSRLDTTGIYLSATAEDLKEAMGRHPLARAHPDEEQSTRAEAGRVVHPTSLVRGPW